MSSIVLCASMPPDPTVDMNVSGAESDIIKPSKEWVLPARGKPGRKPSDSVPPTKRKAQNRASQRAFRERRHAYVCELEQKVAQYQAREIDANVQMQRIALQCREEANALRKSNEELRARYEQMEQQFLAYRRCAEAQATTHSTGCQPPLHEKTHTHCSSRDAISIRGTPTSGTTGPSKLSAVGNEGTEVNVAGSHAQGHKHFCGLRFANSTFSPPSSPTLSTSSEVKTAEAIPSTSYTPTRAVPLRRKHGPSLPLTSLSEGEDPLLDLDCGFCTDATVCVCRGKARLELDEAKPSVTGAGSDSDSAPKPTLWYTKAPEPSSSNAMRLPIRPHRSSRPRLWAVTPGNMSQFGAATCSASSSELAPQCTGDRSTCSACQTDPTLAEFCTAISRNVHLPVSTQRETKTLCESVPHAFTRLRSHPNFPSWRGGLEMLAEIVARDPVSLASDTAPPPTPLHQQSQSTSTRTSIRTNVDPNIHRYTQCNRHKPTMLVRSKAVSEALDILDHQTDNQRVCPCPWAQLPSRLPWPRTPQAKASDRK